MHHVFPLRVTCPEMLPYGEGVQLPTSLRRSWGYTPLSCRALAQTPDSIGELSTTSKWLLGALLLTSDEDSVGRKELWTPRMLFPSPFSSRGLYLSSPCRLPGASATPQTPHPHDISIWRDSCTLYASELTHPYDRRNFCIVPRGHTLLAS